MRRVEVALRLLGPVTRRNRCRWLGLRGLVGARCDRPLWRTARLTRGGWTHRVPARSLPAGAYELRVRATDRAGNVSTAADPASRTLISFRLR